MAREVVVVGAVRTAVGDYGASLKDFPPTKLGAIVIKEVLARSGVAPTTVGHVVMGSVIHGEARDMYLSRVAALDAGLPVGTPCLTVNRLCGSGLQAIVSAAQHIMLGDTDIVVGGGAESMSRAAYFMPAARWGQRMGDAPLVDAMTAALHDPFGNGHMGVTAENIAAKYGITREEQDAFALRSHEKAVAAIEAGRFNDEIVPVPARVVDSANGKPKAVEQLFAMDEGPRRDSSMAALGTLRPAFHAKGTVTAGNSSQMSDGAAAVVLTSAAFAKERGLQPLGRFIAYATAGVEPERFGTGPVPAIKKVLKQAGMTLEQIDLIELNEAFAAQVIACMRELPLDPEKLNVNGGAIALGHPLGCTGAKLTTTLLYELKRRNGRYGLVTMCVGGGQGAAGVIERLS